MRYIPGQNLYAIAFPCVLLCRGMHFCDQKTGAFKQAREVRCMQPCCIDQVVCYSTALNSIKKVLPLPGTLV